MFIQTEETPNPHTMKFIPGVVVLENSSANFTEREQTSASPLAEVLFKIDDVRGVYFGHDFITVSKSSGVEWNILKPAILTTSMDHFVSGMPVMNDITKSAVTSNVSENDSELVKQIAELIETRVRPAVAQDGGDIVYKDFKDGIVYLELHGSCSGCPSSTATLKQGIENMLKHYVPEVVAVEAVQ